MSFHTLKAAALFLLAYCADTAGIVHAQDTPTVPIAAQPLVYMKDGAVQGCGLRLTGGEPSATGASSWFDVSFNVFRRDVALAQSIAYEIKHSEYEGDSRPARVAVQSTWLRAPVGGTRLGENTERRESLIFTLLMEDALSLFEAVATGQPVTLGIKRWGQRVDSVYTGTPAVSAESRGVIGNCLAALVPE